MANPFLKPIFVSFFIQILALGISFLFPGHGFHVSDDVGILSAASGFYGEPDEHLVFTNILFGIILKQLYFLIPAYPWFEILLQATNLVSLSFLGYCLAMRANLYSRWIALVAWPLVSLFFYGYLHFTFSAALAGIAAFSVYFLLADGKGFSNSRMGLLVVTFLTFVSNSIRMEAFWAVTILFLPVFVFRFMADRELRKYLAIGLTFFLSVAMGLKHFNDRYYLDHPQWKRAWDYTLERGHFTDYGMYYSAPIANSVGWSYNDFMALRSWFFADSVVYKIENLKKYRSGIPDISDKIFKKALSPFLAKQGKSEKQVVNKKSASHDNQIPVKPPEGTKVARQPTFSAEEYYLGYFPFALKLMLLPLSIWGYFFMMRRLHFLHFMKGLALLLTGSVFLALVAIYFKLPPLRVLLTVGFSMAFAQFSIYPDFSTINWPKKVYLLFPLMAWLVIGWLEVKGLAHTPGRNLERREGAIKDFERSGIDFRDKVVIYWQGKYSIIDFYEPYSPESLEKWKEYNLLFFGAYFETPFSSPLKEKFQLKRISEDMFLNPHVRLLASPRLVHVYKKFAEEHFGVNLLIVPEDTVLGIYSFKMLPNDKPFRE